MQVFEILVFIKLLIALIRFHCSEPVPDGLSSGWRRRLVETSPPRAAFQSVFDRNSSFNALRSLFIQVKTSQRNYVN